MQKYKCHKEVHAEPMTAVDYFSTTNRGVPQAIDSMAEGYRVIYSQGTDDEYISWSPKKAFDEGYALVEADFEERLNTEAYELEVKTQKLALFLERLEVRDTPKLKQFSPRQEALLRVQVKAMDAYLACLQQRFLLL